MLPVTFLRGYEYIFIVPLFRVFYRLCPTIFNQNFFPVPLFRVMDGVYLNSFCTVVASLTFFCVHDLMCTCLPINDHITKSLFTTGIADCMIFIYRLIVGRHINDPLILVLSRVLYRFRPRRSINDPLFLVNGFFVYHPLFSTPNMLMITRFRYLNCNPLTIIHGKYSSKTSHRQR